MNGSTVCIWADNFFCCFQANESFSTSEATEALKKKLETAEVCVCTFMRIHMHTPSVLVCSGCS